MGTKVFPTHSHGCLTHILCTTVCKVWYFETTLNWKILVNIFLNGRIVQGSLVKTSQFLMIRWEVEIINQLNYLLLKPSLPGCQLEKHYLFTINWTNVIRKKERGCNLWGASFGLLLIVIIFRSWIKNHTGWHIWDTMLDFGFSLRSW